MEFETMRLPVERDEVAPDGSDVRILLRLDRGGMAHFELGPHTTSGAVAHRSVEEIWYVLGGRGQMWRKLGERQEIVPMKRGVCLSIPVGTRFQFRTQGQEALSVIGITMPPWPGAGEAYEVEGAWPISE